MCLCTGPRAASAWPPCWTASPRTWPPRDWSPPPPRPPPPPPYCTPWRPGPSPASISRYPGHILVVSTMIAIFLKARFLKDSAAIAIASVGFDWQVNCWLTPKVDMLLIVLSGLRKKRWHLLHSNSSYLLSPGACPVEAGCPPQRASPTWVERWVEPQTTAYWILSYSLVMFICTPVQPGPFYTTHADCEINGLWIPRNDFITVIPSLVTMCSAAARQARARVLNHASSTFVICPHTDTGGGQGRE